MDILNRVQRVLVPGDLEFRILADPQRHAKIIELAADEKFQSKRIIQDDAGKMLAKWVRVPPASDPVKSEFKIGISECVIRDARSKERITLSDVPRHQQGDALLFGPNRLAIREFLAKEYSRTDGSTGGVEEIELLVVTSEEDPVGADLSLVRQSTDSKGRPCIDFNTTTAGGIKVGKITAQHLPDSATGREYRVAVILDNEVLTAPAIRGMITNSGQITGEFTAAEVNELCVILGSGKFTFTLKPEPVSSRIIEPK